MEKKWRDALVTAAVFIAAIVIGGIYVDRSPYGYTESALLFLAAVIAAGCYWIGGKRSK